MHQANLARKLSGDAGVVFVSVSVEPNRTVSIHHSIGADRIAEATASLMLTTMGVVPGELGAASERTAAT